jgi:hypothetical protein
VAQIAEVFGFQSAASTWAPADRRTVVTGHAVIIRSTQTPTTAPRVAALYANGP